MNLSTFYKRVKDFILSKETGFVSIAIFLTIFASGVISYLNTPALKQIETIKTVECQAPPKPTGCDLDPKLTNDQIISETHKCESAGLVAEALHCGDDWTTTIIQCKPKKGIEE